MLLGGDSSQHSAAGPEIPAEQRPHKLDKFSYRGECGALPQEKVSHD